MQWETISREVQLKINRFLTVENHVVKLSNGKIIPEWPWIISPDFVNVFAITKKQKILCFRQSKYGIDGMSLAPVGGYIEDEESPINAAARELLEETGYKSNKWVEIGKFRVDPNRGIATGYFFLACDAYYYCQPNSDDIEDQELLFLSMDELEASLKEGQFKVLSWAFIANLAVNYLRNRTSQHK